MRDDDTVRTVRTALAIASGALVILIFLAGYRILPALAWSAVIFVLAALMIRIFRDEPEFSRASGDSESWRPGAPSADAAAVPVARAAGSTATDRITAADAPAAGAGVADGGPADDAGAADRGEADQDGTAEADGAGTGGSGPGAGPPVAAMPPAALRRRKGADSMARPQAGARRAAGRSAAPAAPVTASFAEAAPAWRPAAPAPRGRKGADSMPRPVRPAAPAAAAAAPAPVAPAPAAPAAKPDDLKIIKGIGPKIERQLNEKGVTTFAQIAAWSEAEIDQLEDDFGFPGRIRRDDWITQARVLAAGVTDA